jgi:hypothetical protein
MVGQLPAMIRPLATNYMGLFQQLDNTDIDIFIEKIKKTIEFVEFGESSDATTSDD